MGRARVRRLAMPESVSARSNPDRGQIGSRDVSRWVARVGWLPGGLPEAEQGHPCSICVRSGRLAWWSSVDGGPRFGEAQGGGRPYCLAWWSFVDGEELDGGCLGGRFMEWERFSSILPVLVPDLVVDVAILVCFGCVNSLLRVFILLFGCLIPRKVFATPIRPELSFSSYFFRVFWPLGSWFSLTWWRGRKNLRGQIWASNGAGNRGKIPPYLMTTVLLLSVQLYFACLASVIRVVPTHGILILRRIRFIAVCPVKRALWIPRKGSITPTWPELGFGSHFLLEIMPFGDWLFPIWYSDSLQEITLCKRIITVVGGFALQSLAGDPGLVVYIICVLCIFNGFVCLFHGTSLFRDLYELLIELLSAVMDFVQFNH